ncbi:MAG: HEPN domain-containing protein [Cyanobacteriota bacterium]|nr:HEPN domain-containing protein [Cyanobacteriota bacterium]
MNRNKLQTLARLRLAEAKVLLDRSQYSGAYYLSGYVVECALKACIAKETKEFDFPDLRTVRDSYIHDLEKLVKTSELKVELDRKADNDPDFAYNWSIAIQWSEASRYEIYDEEKAKAMYEAIADVNHGVLQWIEQYW